MTLDVPSEYEDILRQAVALGGFTDERSALCHALQLLAKEQQVEVMLDDLSPEDAVAALGTGPSVDLDVGASQSWPSDEPIDDWIADLNSLRGRDPQPRAL